MRKPAGPGSSHVVGRHPHHAHQTAAQHAKRVEASQDAAATRKHNKARGKGGGTSKHKRGLPLTDAVACCAAEALAASLRLTGRSVNAADVLALYSATADDLDAGASILDTLSAAQEHGLGGHYPIAFEEVMPCVSAKSDGYTPDPSGLRATRAGLIIGIDLPGPHTVLEHDGAWWSWGELHDPASFPDAIVEEAWLVRWAA